MKNYQTLILDRKSIERLVNLKQAIVCVESAFGEYSKMKVQMPSKIYLDLPKFDGDFRAMPAYIEKINGCSLKWVNVHKRNKNIGLPTVMAVVILSDPKTGYPLAIMDGTLITSVRTAAAGAVAAKYLANKNPKIVALVGCGVQAVAQLEALRLLFQIIEVRVWGNEKKISESFVKKIQIPNEKMISVNTVFDCVENADIVVTTTPSFKPLIKLNWLKKGVHINAIGADAPGKQELDINILKKSKLVIDDWNQASYSGEINVAVSKKIISKKNIYAEIGEIVLGRKKGRTNFNEITVFDSTGLAIQDTAVAQIIYKEAIKKNIGLKVKLI